MKENMSKEMEIFFPLKNKANVNIRNENFSEPNKSTMESFTHKLNQEEKEDTKDKGHGQWNSTQASNRKKNLNNRGHSIQEL